MNKLLFSFLIIITANIALFSAETAEVSPDLLFWNCRGATSPYSPCPFTKISEEQIARAISLTNDPKWASGNSETVKEYYSLHDETQLDRNFCCMATYFMGVVLHGDTNQETLNAQLNLFNIRKLLSEGPYHSSILSIPAQNLIYQSIHEMDSILDIHLHNLGYDEGNFLNPEISAQKKTSCKNYFTFLVLRYASGMTSPIGSTHEARKRLHLYAAHFPKLSGCVLPIHKSFLDCGFAHWHATGSFLKNRSGLLTAVTFDNPYADSELLPAVSIHPFDPNWKTKLLNAHAKGILLVKWMPPQSIPPDSELLDDYYKMMKQLNMTLIAHAGAEHANPTEKNNQHWSDWGNPLRFRKPLKIGVNVILAHCGHCDLLPDLDHPDRPKVPGYELFFRIAREAHQKNQTGEWTGLVYGDLAAVTTHYGTEFIKELLKVAHEPGIRLIYGSDYPYTNLIRPSNDAYELCAAADILDPAKVAPLKEIRSWNPLLANYIFTKNLKLEIGGVKIGFPEETFTGQFKGAELRLIDRVKWNRYKNNPWDL